MNLESDEDLGNMSSNPCLATEIEHKGKLLLEYLIYLGNPVRVLLGHYTVGQIENKSKSNFFSSNCHIKAPMFFAI